MKCNELNFGAGRLRILLRIAQRPLEKSPPGTAARK